MNDIRTFAPLSTITDVRRSDTVERLRGVQVLDNGWGAEVLIIEAKRGPHPQDYLIALALDAIGDFWILTLKYAGDGDRLFVKRADGVFRSSLFDALRQFAEAC